MTCKSCGAPLSDDAVFCAQCGCRIMLDDAAQARDQSQGKQEKKPRKKKTIKAILIIAAALVTVAIVVGAYFVIFAQKNDKVFLQNLVSGLQDRWVIADTFSDDMATSEYKAHLRDCVNAELDELGVFDDYVFDDAKLESYAERYFAALDSQMKGIDFYGKDDSEYERLFNTDGYFERAIILYYLSDEYNLTVDESHEESLDELVTNGKYALQDGAAFTAVSNLIDESIVLNALGGSNYELLVKNTTEYSFTNIWFNFSFFDDDGVIVNTTQSYLEKWNSGEQNRISVYSDADFSRVEMSIEFYNFSGNLSRTENKSISYTNEMNIVVQLSGLPQSIDYSSRNSVVTTCIIQDFRYEEGYWSDGKCSVKLFFSGKKTYDAKGTNYSRDCRIGWKLYNDNGVVVSSGTIYSPDISVGESFLDCQVSTDALAPGTYTLELLNIA